LCLYDIGNNNTPVSSGFAIARISFVSMFSLIIADHLNIWFIWIMSTFEYAGDRGGV